MIQASLSKDKLSKTAFDVAAMDFVQFQVDAQLLPTDTQQQQQTPIISEYPELQNTEWLYDQTALQEYILLCCQVNTGGLRDKPGKSRDYYHSCYSLSGLTLAQHSPTTTSVLGDPANLLRKTNPIFNLCRERVVNAWKYFGNKSYL